MKKTLLLILFSCLTGTCICKTANLSKQLLSLIKLNNDEATPNKISSLFGQPERVEEKNKTAKWFYSNDNTELTLYWDNRSSKLEKYSFKNIQGEKKQWDNAYGRGLRSGTTSLAQVIKAIGMPNDMVAKTNHQDLHYAFQNNTLHLFFRKGVLINFAFY